MTRFFNLTVLGQVLRRRLHERGTFSVVSATGVRIVGGVLQLAVHAFLAVQLGAAGYGAFAPALLFANALTYLLSFGFVGGSTRFLGEYVSQRRVALASGFLLCAVAANLGGSLLFCALLVAASWAGLDSAFSVDLLPLALLVCSANLFGLAIELLRGVLAPAFAAAFQGIFCNAVIFLMILVLDESARPMSVDFAVKVFAFAHVASALVMFVMTIMRLTRLIGIALPVWAIATWLRSCAPVALGATMAALSQSADLYCVNLLLGAPEAGVYAVAKRIINALELVPLALLGGSLPHLSVAFYGADGEKFRNQLLAVTVVAFGYALVLGSVAAAFSPLLMAAFGNEFAAGAPLLGVLLIGFAIRFACGPWDQLMMMAGYGALYLTFTTAALVYSVSVIPLGVVALDEIGAALAMCLLTALLGVWGNLVLTARIGGYASPIMILVERVQNIRPSP